MFDYHEEVKVGGYIYRVHGDFREKLAESRCGQCGGKKMINVWYLHHVAEIIDDASAVKIPINSQRGRLVIRAMHRKLESEIRCSNCSA